MENKKDVIICLGSSCFSRGNKKAVQTIKDYIQNKNLSEKIYFHGAHCFGICDKGPILKIDNTMYEKVDETNIKDILNLM